MSFQKAGNFSKIISLPRSWLSQFIESIPESPGIYTGKRTANKEIPPATFILKPTVLRLELRILQDLCALESRCRMLSGNIKFSQIRHRELGQLGAGK